MKQKQHYMTRDERLKLETLLEEKRSVAYIAKKLGFCRQTIYNEKKRGTYIHTKDYWDEERYSADKGHQIQQYNQTAKGRALKIGKDRDYADFIEDQILHKRCSPAVALCRARTMGFTTSICVSTLYSYIDKGIFLHITNKNLWEKSKRKTKGYKPVSRVVHPKLPSIEDSPEYINNRLEYGHWEMDLVLSKKGSRGALLTLTERQSRQELILKIPNKKAATVREVFNRLERSTPNFKRKFRSITTDNGSEFLELAQLRRSIYGGDRFDVWYCHSYAAWEKGTNENHNRMIRRWFPKGTDFDKVTKKQVAEVQNWMNGYQRKSLNWQCPAQIA